jgi:gluconolactonase
MRVVVLSDNIGCAEGPVELRDGAFAVTSIDRGVLYRLTAQGERSLLAVTGGGPNGATVGADGSLYVAQSGGRRGAGPARRRVMSGGVQVIRSDGGQEWITQDPISPNDLCFGPDGRLWVTDPTDELGDGRLWRVDVDRREAELLLSVDWYTNGIGFGAESDVVYVSSTNEGRLYRFPLVGDRLGRPEMVFEIPDGRPDGFAFDTDGNVVLGVVRSGRSSEIQTWTTEGRLIDTFVPGSTGVFTNLLLTRERQLLVTMFRGDDGVLLLEPWPRAGLPLHPFRPVAGPV